MSGNRVSDSITNEELVRTRLSKYMDQAAINFLATFGFGFSTSDILRTIV